MKKRYKKKTQIAENSNNVPHVSVEVDYNKLAQAMVKAQMENERIRKEKKAAEAEEINARKREILHEKDFSHVKCWLWRKIRYTLNQAGVMCRLLFLSKKDAKYFPGVMPFTKMLASGLVRTIQWGFYLLCATCVYGAHQSLDVFNTLTLAVVAIVFFGLARLIRLARFEIENMEDGAELMTTAMLIMTVFSIIIAAVSVIASATGKGG